MVFIFISPVLQKMNKTPMLIGEFKTLIELIEWFDKTYQNNKSKGAEFVIPLKEGRTILMKLQYAPEKRKES